MVDDRACGSMEMGDRVDVEGAGVPFAAVDSGRVVVLVVGVTADDGGDGNKWFPFIMADSRGGVDGGGGDGVGVDTVETRSPLG